MRPIRLVFSLLLGTVLTFTATASASIAGSPVVLEWEKQSPPAGIGAISAAYGNGRFVAAGVNGAVISSQDGQTWRLVHQEPPPSGVPGWALPNLKAVTYGNNLFVAVGNPRFLVMTSPDGDQWDVSYQWTGDTSQGYRQLEDVTYGGGRFVAVGQDRGVASQTIASTDGVQWSHSDIFPGVSLAGVAYDGTRFLTVGATADGQRGAVWNSADGTVWTPVDVDLPPLRSVVYSQGRFLAIGNLPEGDTTTYLFTSKDGVTWERSLLPGDFSPTRVTATGGFFFLLGGGTNEPTPLALSADGVHWVATEAPAAVSQVVAGGDKLMAIGWGGTIFTLSPCARFIDIPQADSACRAATMLQDMRVVNGYPDGTFQPGAAVTRAEFAKMLILTLGKSPLPTTPLAFSDTGGHWAAEQGYIQAALSIHVISGYPDGTFHPDAPVTRAELIKMIAGAASIPHSGQEASYTDVTTSDWFAASVSCAVDAGLIGPRAAIPVWPGPTLNPNQQATRAEAAIALSNLVSQMNRNGSP